MLLLYYYICVLILGKGCVILRRSLLYLCPHDTTTILPSRIKSSPTDATEPRRLAKQSARRNRASRVPPLIFLSSEPPSHNFMTRQKTVKKNSRGLPPPLGLQTHESIFTCRTILTSAWIPSLSPPNSSPNVLYPLNRSVTPPLPLHS
jgi:hypothetical protein